MAVWKNPVWSNSVGEYVRASKGGSVSGCGRRNSWVEVTSMELVKLSSLVVSWIDQTLRSLLSATSVDVLDAHERGRGSWSGSLSS
jgi:hypothetical protein